MADRARMFEEALAEDRLVSFRYRKKTTGSLVVRNARPLEFKGKYLYVDHGGRTKSFIVSRILFVKKDGPIMESSEWPSHFHK